MIKYGLRFVSTPPHPDLLPKAERALDFLACHVSTRAGLQKSLYLQADVNKWKWLSGTAVMSINTNPLPQGVVWDEMIGLSCPILGALANTESGIP